jgi:ankyrin repeat protein
MLHERVVALLLEHGADVSARAKGQWTPLDFAASGRLWDDGDGPERFAPLAKTLLRGGAAPSSISAVALGDVDWVRARHAEGTLINATSFDVFGPFGGLLSIAVKHNRPEMLALLLDLGLDPDERMRLEDTEEVSYSWGLPLHHCAGSGKFAMAEMLLAHGADPNGQVCTSGTPVGRAYGARDWAMVKLLERHGGVVYAANAGYYRDAELARRLFADEAAGRLREGTVDTGTTLAETLLGSGATGGDPEIVHMALARIDWPRNDPRWYWKLQDPLCFWNHMPGIPTANPEFDRGTYLTCFRLVLERCDPNVRPERFGQTALHEVAAMGGHVTSKEVVEFAKALLDAGARLDIRDDLLKSTPLGWACRWGRADLVRLLLERGADPVEPDAEPWATPQAWAEKMGRDSVLAVLREHAR